MHHFQTSRSARWTLCVVAMFAIVVAPLAASADSPLTSTSFHSEYMDVAAVSRATQGLSRPVMQDLSDPAIGNDVRAAIVNALGWTFGGQNHAQRYATYLARQRGVPLRSLQLTDIDAHEVFALGYMAAMDDYSNLSAIPVDGELGEKTPYQLLHHANTRLSNEFVVRTIRSLVAAQEEMHRGRAHWCKAYRITGAATNGQPGPFRAEALRVITRYMNLYADSCQPRRQRPRPPPFGHTATGDDRPAKKLRSHRNKPLRDRLRGCDLVAIAGKA